MVCKKKRGVILCSFLSLRENLRISEYFLFCFKRKEQDSHKTWVYIREVGPRSLKLKSIALPQWIAIAKRTPHSSPWLVSPGSFFQNTKSFKCMFYLNVSFLFSSVNNISTVNECRISELYFRITLTHWNPTSYSSTVHFTKWFKRENLVQKKTQRTVAYSSYVKCLLTPHSVLSFYFARGVLVDTRVSLENKSTYIYIYYF